MTEEPYISMTPLSLDMVSYFWGFRCVLLAPLPPTLGDVLVRRWEYLHLGYYCAAARAAVWNLDVDRREEVYRCVPPCLMGLFHAHLFYHTEEKVRKDGVEWDGVVYCMDLCKWGDDWMEEDGLWVTKALKILADLHCHDFLVNLGASYHPLQEGRGPVSYYGTYARFVGSGESPMHQHRSGAWGADHSLRGVEGVGMHRDLCPSDFLVEV